MIIFKALTGFGEEREVFFDETDLEKVQYAFLREKRLLLSNGQAIDGKYIQQIMPDWVRSMGWNTAHTLDADDMNEIKASGIMSQAYQLLESSKERVHFLLEANREAEIGKGVEIPHLENPDFGRRSGVMTSIRELLSGKEKV